MTHRMVVVSDLHAHPWAAFGKGDGAGNSRLRRTLAVLDASLSRAREEDLTWLFAGDIVHTAGYALNPVLSGLTEVLARYPEVRKVAVWGNHDARGVGGKIDLEHTVWATLSRVVPDLHVLDDSHVEFGRFPIYGAGYQPRPDLLPEFPKDRALVGVFHQTVRGSLTPTGFALDEGVDPEALMACCRVAIVGHVHHAQQMPASLGRAILVPGSPEHHNFGDEGDHGWWVLSIPEDPNQDPEVEFVDGGSPRFLTVDEPKNVQPDGNFYRVRSVGAGAKLPDNASAIAPSPTSVTEREVLRGASTPELILQAWMRESPPEEGLEPSAVLALGRQLLSNSEPVHLRPVRLRKIVLENFCSYALAELNVREGVWLVTGEGRDYPSNGAGKTTLTGEALHWCLFGRNTKGLASDEVIRRGEKLARVTVELEEPDGSWLSITRTKSTKESSLAVGQSADPNLTEDGSDWVVWNAASVNEMTDKLTRWLGITPEIHQTLGYFSQEKLLLFSSATDGERKSVLADLIGLSSYQEAASAAGSLVSRHEQEEVSLRGRAGAQEEVVGQLELRTAQETEAAAEWQRLHGEAVAAAKEEVDAVQKENDHRAVLLDQKRMLLATRITRRLEEVTTLLSEGQESRTDSLEKSANADLLRQLDEAADERRRAWEMLSPGYQRAEDVDAALSKLEQLYDEKLRPEDAAAQRTYGEAEREVTKLSAALGAAIEDTSRCVTAACQHRAILEAGTCPTCGQGISEEHRKRAERPLIQQAREADARTTSIREALAKAEEEAKKAEAVVKRTSSMAEAAISSRKTLLGIAKLVRDWEKADAQVSILQTRLGEQRKIAEERAAHETEKEIARQVERLTTRLRRAADAIARVVAKGDARLTAAAARLRAIEDATNPHQAAAERTTEALRVARGSLEDTRAAAQKAALGVAAAEYWRRGFGKQGIQSLLTEEVAGIFNRARSDIFPVLTQGVYDVQFSTLSRTKGGEVRERTEFVVREHGNPVPYGALSGGQRRRVDVGVMLTLAVAVSEWLGVPGVLGVMTLDEVFGFLDESGGEGLLDALRVVQEHIPTIYCVTHDARLQSLFPAAIKVVQDERGISTLV